MADADKLRRLFRFATGPVSLDDVCEQLKEAYNRQEEVNRRLREKNKELTDEHWKDKTLQEMQARLDNIIDKNRRGFPITAEEQRAINKWRENHYATQHNVTTNAQKLQMGGVIGGTFHYEFVPTSIGTSGSCVCGSCQSRAMREAKGDRKKYRELLKKYDAEFEFQEIG